MSRTRTPTRWEQATSGGAATDGTGHPGYAAHFAALVAQGADFHAEARLADTLVDRGARVLDVGAGMGRVAAELAARGHAVTAIEPDADLRAQAAATYPVLRVLPHDVRDVEATPGPFDLVVCVGNVLVYLAEGTEREVLAGLAARLAPDGRVLAGFHLLSARAGARDYAPAEFEADVAATGLRVQARFGGYDLRPPSEEYAVWLLARA